MMYAKRCVYAYKSKKGEMEATVISNKISFSPENFTKEELEAIKKQFGKNARIKFLCIKSI